MISASLLPFLFFALQGGSADVRIAQHASPLTHCLKHEERVFSCQIQKSNKVLSLCAVPAKAKNPGYLQYRFGRPGHVELQYPQAKSTSYSKFNWQSIGYSGGWDTRIQFSNAGYRYQIYDRAYKIDIKRKDRSGGVLVLKGNKQLAELKCSPQSFGPNPYAWGLNDLYERVPQGNFFSD